jgi:hypothetical protein
MEVKRPITEPVHSNSAFLFGYVTRTASVGIFCTTQKVTFYVAKGRTECILKGYIRVYIYIYICLCVSSITCKHGNL